MTDTPFTGFPEETLGFLERLKKNNDRDWFKAHRGEFDDFVLGPARSFVVALGDRLRASGLKVVADPRTDKSIFRLHRDTRFSKDKSPYKTHLAILLWEGDGPKMECPGFYFHLDPETLMIGGGIYMFPPHQLREFRRSVDHDKRGPALEKILKQAGKLVPSEPHAGKYKRVPRGFDADHPRAELLKLKGLTFGEEIPPPPALHSRKLVEFCARRYEKMAPVHRWLLEMTRRANSDAD